jgi:putative copper export protein
MLAVSWDTVRLFLHVLAATIWVGGQLTLAALVPVLRRFGADALGAAARRFNQVAWTAFGVLIVTGSGTSWRSDRRSATAPATARRSS